MTGRIKSSVMIGMAAIAGAAALAGDGDRYRVIVIPSPPGAAWSDATSINNSGQVTGVARIDGRSRAFGFSDGQSFVIDEIPGTDTSVNAINDAGHIAGWMYEWGIIWPQAFLWDENGNHPLGNPEHDHLSYGNAMNDHDMVVGFYYPPGSHANGDAFVNIDGEMKNLGSGQAYDINNAGQIVGEDNRYFGATTLWEPDGGGGWSRSILDGLAAQAINESGTMIVGKGPLSSYLDNAAVWTLEDGAWVRTQIGEGEWDPQMVSSLALDVNDAEQVIGDYSAFPENEPRAFIYEDGKVQWLTDRLSQEFDSWTIENAVAINESGQILARATSDVGQSDLNVILVPDRLTVLGPRPGVAGQSNALIATSATPGSRVYFVYGFASGLAAIPGCPGVNVDIASPQVAGGAIASQEMEARITTFVPAGAAGRTIYLQAVEPESCTVSNVVRYVIR